MYTEIKYVKDDFCVGHLSSVNLVTNAQHAVIDPPVGATLQQCWEKWETLGSSPKVVTILREGYTLPFRFRPNLTRSPTVVSNYHNPAKQSFLWSIHSSHGIHSGGQRGQTHGTSEGYKDPPVPRQVAGESLYPQHLSPAYSNPGHTLSGTRVVGEQGEVRTGPQTGFQLRVLPVRPERGQG